MDLGLAIKSIRKQKGLKQNQFAELCEITPSYLSQIENNNKEPNLSILKIISNNLGTPLPILFFLSLDNDDINPEKKEAFKMIAPSIKSLVNQFFAV
ncbi:MULTISPECIES: helix-turn-helix domain-containing protein [Flavobacteriaceae]|jgi:transcriptional regulator with XRE-family HTH domain|uniref:Helix-turn-helix transcriptional regulator n=2 Tax=Flavobacteriaceae TaxID=49546 RepID=A0ABU1EU02_9FLAO|nr:MULTISPECIES: helix-turn-helix transcriptional regulator [Flavobacteriaceae]MDN3665048.1 helix-turn-helix transcriptional regulator [Algibacter miyuki]MDR5591867.1 helix-turn-helix transcriptional regulator [Christiangramia sp. SM2212]|tara:strand:+ start:862 stop:1152 length:291 start_codon:yes stop_codon:yes gene_type:complete